MCDCSCLQPCEQLSGERGALAFVPTSRRAPQIDSLRGVQNPTESHGFEPLPWNDSPALDSSKPVKLILEAEVLNRGLENKTCLQCGQSPADKDIRRTFRYQPWWIVLLLCLSLGIFLVLPVTWIFHDRTLSGSFRLCRSCKWSIVWAEGKRSLSIVMALLLPVGAVLLKVSAESQEILAWAAGAFLAGSLLSVLIHIKTRAKVIKCTKMKEDNVTLRVSPNWRMILEKEHPEALVSSS